MPKAISVYHCGPFTITFEVGEGWAHGQPTSADQKCTNERFCLVDTFPVAGVSSFFHGRRTKDAAAKSATHRLSHCRDRSGLIRFFLLRSSSGETRARKRSAASIRSTGR